MHLELFQSIFNLSLPVDYCSEIQHAIHIHCSACTLQSTDKTYSAHLEIFIATSITTTMQMFKDGITND